MHTKAISLYKIDKTRREELTRICWQYKRLKKEADDLLTGGSVFPDLTGVKAGAYGKHSDPVLWAAERRERILAKTSAIEKAARIAGGDNHDALFYGVITRGSSYDKMRVNGRVFCGCSQYYEMKQKFFWLLDKMI